MADMAPTEVYAEALLAERAGALRANRGDRVIMIEEELRLRGFQVAKDGSLAPVSEAKVSRPRKENAAAKPAPERATPKD